MAPADKVFIRGVEPMLVEVGSHTMGQHQTNVVLLKKMKKTIYNKGPGCFNTMPISAGKGVIL